jgi:hypothetical protein
MARQVQRTITLPAADLAKVEELADAAPPSIDKATFYRYSLVLGAYILDQTLKEIKPEKLGLKAVHALLKTKAGRRLVQVSAAEEELTEERIRELTE